MSAIILIFRSRNNALTIRSFLLANNVFAKLIDTPRALSASCGLAVEIVGQAGEFLKQILLENNKMSLVEGVYGIHFEDNQKRYVLI